MWHQWLEHASFHYDHIFAYVVGDLNEAVQIEFNELRDFVTVINWPLVLKTGDLEHMVAQGSGSKMIPVDSGKQEIPYFGQYLAHLDCQRRALSKKYTWFQPAEMDSFVNTNGTTPYALKDIMSQISLQQPDRVETLFQLVDRDAKEQMPHSNPLSWLVIQEAPRRNTRYAALTTTSCQACVHSLCCKKLLGLDSHLQDSIRMIHFMLAP